MSWVAITTDVPDLLSSMNRRSRRCASAGIDVAGRLVGEQHLGPRDHRARDRGALLLAAREHRRQRTTCGRRGRPSEQLGDFVAVALFVPADHLSGSATLSIGREVIEQAEVLEHDADAAAQHRQRVLAQRRGVVIEQADQAARRPQRQEQQAQQRRLAGAGRARRNWNEWGAILKLRSRRISDPSP